MKQRVKHIQKWMHKLKKKKKADAKSPFPPLSQIAFPLLSYVLVEKQPSQKSGSFFLIFSPLSPLASIANQPSKAIAPAS